MNELIGVFREYLQQREKQMAAGWTPKRGHYLVEALIHDVLVHKIAENTSPENRRKHAFFSQLLNAWDALAYDRYEVGSGCEYYAGLTLSKYHFCRMYA